MSAEVLMFLLSLEEFLSELRKIRSAKQRLRSGTITEGAVEIFLVYF